MKTLQQNKHLSIGVSVCIYGTLLTNNVSVGLIQKQTAKMMPFTFTQNHMNYLINYSNYLRKQKLLLLLREDPVALKPN